MTRVCLCHGAGATCRGHPRHTRSNLAELRPFRPPPFPDSRWPRLGAPVLVFLGPVVLLSFHLGLSQLRGQLGVSTVVRQEHHYVWQRRRTRFRSSFRVTRKARVGLMTAHELGCPVIALSCAVV